MAGGLDRPPPIWEAVGVGKGSRKKKQRSKAAKAAKSARATAAEVDESSETSDTGADAPPPESTPGAEAGPSDRGAAPLPGHPRGLPDRYVAAGGGLLALLAVLAIPEAGLLDYQPSWSAARFFLALGGLLVALSRALGHLGARRWAAGAAIVSLTLGLVAAFGRNHVLHQSPFEASTPALAGLPTALAFVLIAAGARGCGRAPASARARATLVIGTLWASFALLAPNWVLGEAEVPLFVAFEQLGSPELGTLLQGLVVVILAMVVAAAWITIVRLGVKGEAALRGGARNLPTILAGGLAMLAGYHVVAPLIVALTPPTALIAGPMLALALLVMMATLEPILQEGAPLPGAERRWVRRALEWSPPAAVLLVFLLIKTHGMVPSTTDENIYFYMAADLANGRWPYVDYFFAHPPLHVIVPGLFFTVFGYSFTFAKVFSIAAASIAGLAVYGIGRRHFGRFAAVAAMIGFLFAVETLKASTNMTGINLTIMWLMLGMWQSMKGRGLSAGILFGLAATTGFYSMAAICALLLVGAFRDKRFALRQLAGFVAVFGAINLIFYIAAGDAFIDGVYTYHGLKAFKDDRMISGAFLHNLGVMLDGKPFTREVYYHAHLWMALAVAPLLGALRFWFDREPKAAAEAEDSGKGPRGRRARPTRAPLWRFFDPRRFWTDGAHGAAAIVWLVALALFVQFSMFRELYSFYFTLIYPVLALLFAYLLSEAPRFIAAATGGLPQAGARIGLAALVLVVLALWRPLAADANRVFWDEFQAVGRRNPYVWYDAPVASGLSDIVYQAFWNDQRLRGDDEEGYRYYLWTKKRGFSTVDEIADWIRSNTTEDETITGASTIAPLVALAAERRLAAGEADTNSKRFKSGLLDEETFWNAVCADKVRYIISTDRSFFTDDRPRRPGKMSTSATTRRWFKRVKVFYDPTARYGRKYPIAIFERQGEPPAEGMVCQYEGS